VESAALQPGSKALEINRHVAQFKVDFFAMRAARLVDSDLKHAPVALHSNGTAGRMLRTLVKILSSTHLRTSSEMIYHSTVGVYPCRARRSTDHW